MDGDPESALVTELRALAGPGAAAGESFAVVLGRVRITVSYVSGSSSSLTLSARYDEVAQRHPGASPDAPRGYRQAPSGALRATRPLDLTLRREQADDVAAKREGAAVEWQSGDPLFDDMVYVDTPTTDAAVLGMVLNEEVRAGTLALMALGFANVKIDDDGYVRATMVTFAQRDAPPPDRGRQAAEAFARILGNLPALAHSGVSRPPTPLAGWTALLGLIGAIGWVLNVDWLALIVAAFQAVFPLPRGATESLSTGSLVASVGLGLLAGALAWKGYGDLVLDRVRGRSDTHRIVAGARLAAFGGVSVLAFAVALIVALALARC